MFDIATMTPSDAAIAIAWAAAEGWNPGSNDAECFYAADPDGFFIGKLNGEPIGSISAVKYPGGFGFIGLYIVRPEFRGKGYGSRLWRKAMNYLDGCNIGLDGVVEQQENYKRSGFQLAHRNIRFELRTVPNDIPYSMRDVRDIREFSLADIAEYDRKHFLFERNAFLEPWIRQQNAKGRVLVENGSIRGYGVIRSCRRGYKIGPLFANDERATEDIFLSLVHTTYGEHIYLDVPEVNPRALHLAESYKMQKVFETARMYTAGDPGLPLQNIFGITSFELG